jgi:hypothetical protein
MKIQADGDTSLMQMEDATRIAELAGTRNPQGCVTPPLLDEEQRVDGSTSTTELYKKFYSSNITLVFDEKEHRLTNAADAPNYDEPRRCTQIAEGDLIPSLDSIMPGLLAETTLTGDLTHLLAGLAGRDYVREQIKHLPFSDPVIAVSAEIKEGREPLFKNFLCSLSRLGLEKRIVVFAIDDRAAKAARSVVPQAVVLRHETLDEAAFQIGVTTAGVPYRNRFMKVLGAAMLLSFNHSVLVADIDQFWFRDPTPELLSHDVDMVTMQDVCPLESNSGFVFYKPTPAVNHMLRTFLSLRRNPDPKGAERYRQIFDNDQYFLNCAMAGSAAMGSGLKVHLLRKAGFIYGPKIREDVCRNPALLSVWHSGGMSVTTGGPLTFKVNGFWHLDPDKPDGGSECLDIPHQSINGFERGDAKLKQLLQKFCVSGNNHG